MPSSQRPPHPAPPSSRSPQPGQAFHAGRPGRSLVRQQYLGRISDDGQKLEIYVKTDGGEHLPLPLRSILGDTAYDLLEMARTAVLPGETVDDVLQWMAEELRQREGAGEPA